jgi:hypothetical protein
MDSKKKRGLVGEVERKLRPLWLILPELRLPVRAHLVTACLAESTTRTNLFFPGLHIAKKRNYKLKVLESRFFLRFLIAKKLINFLF